jgi:hypothetical protein
MPSLKSVFIRETRGKNSLPDLGELGGLGG